MSTDSSFSQWHVFQPLAVMVKILNTLVTGTAVLRGRLHTFPADKAVVALLDLFVSTNLYDRHSCLQSRLPD